MSDLISREDAINAIYHHFPNVSMERATEILHECESMEKKGEWKDYPIADGCVKCSMCGVLSMARTNYCATCGYDMRKEK